MAGVGIADAIIGGPLRGLGGIAQGIAIISAGEITLRALDKLSQMVLQQELPKDFEGTEKKNWISKNIFDIRHFTRTTKPLELLILTISAVVTSMLLNEGAYRAFGSPIKGMNMFGRLIGIQFSNTGIIDNLNFSDWREFFHRAN